MELKDMTVGRKVMLWSDSVWGLGKGAHKDGGVLPCLFQTCRSRRSVSGVCITCASRAADCSTMRQAVRSVLLQMGVQRQQSPPVGRGRRVRSM